MRVELPILNFPKQQQVFDCKARIITVPKGRRFGITTGGANNIIRGAIKREFRSALWGDVVNSNIEKYIQRLFIPKLLKLPQSMWKWTRNPSMLQIADSYIDFRSAERPEAWGGHQKGNSEYVSVDGYGQGGPHTCLVRLQIVPRSNVGIRGWG